VRGISAPPALGTAAPAADRRFHGVHDPGRQRPTGDTISPLWTTPRDAGGIVDGALASRGTYGIITAAEDQVGGAAG